MLLWMVVVACGVEGCWFRYCCMMLRQFVVNSLYACNEKLLALNRVFQSLDDGWGCRSFG